VLLTAGDQEEAEINSLLARADDFIRKPFKMELLEQRLSNLLELRKNLRLRYSQELVLQAKEIAVTPADELFLNKVQEVLDKHLSDPEFSTQKFCALIGMSRMQLHRKLMAYTGLSTSAFIRSQRIKQAADLLQNSQLNVNEVAYTVGFSTPSYFIKCFKEIYKKTPLEFVQQSDY
jgi:transcriptional regulator GlxA family with amidase domain